MQGVADLLVGGVLVADPHVLGDGGGEDVGVLGQVPDPAAPPHRARVRRDQPHGGHRQGGFADAGGAGAGHLLPGFHHQVEAVSEHRGAGPADGHAVEFQSGAGLPVRDDVTGADRVGVENLPDAGQGGAGAGPRLGGRHESRQHLVQGQRHQRQDRQEGGVHGSGGDGGTADRQPRDHGTSCGEHLRRGGHAPHPRAARLQPFQAVVDLQ